jgi:ADP-dependent NAD(P)H-hydrate dehydratase / NAD(P)H-hydrate epimerase
MKLFTTAQIAELDRYTIENVPISDIDLMERASRQISGWILNKFSADKRIAVFAGPGNNGGDAIAVSRMLKEKNYSVDLYLPDFGRELGPSPAINLQRFKDQGLAGIYTLHDSDPLPDLHSYDILIDGLFGSGLSRPLTGFPSKLVKHMNDAGVRIIAIDIPSGLMGEDNRLNDTSSIIKADITLALQFPKLSFFFPENEPFVGEWEVLPIGIHPEGIENTETEWRYTDRETAVSLRKTRKRFSHKGTFGHALLIVGSYGKTGAAVLAAKGCLRAGSGLVTVHLPKSGIQIMQTAFPEAMVSADESDNIISQIPSLDAYSAIGTGPGLGKANETQMALLKLLRECKCPLVIDADGLNILSENQEWLKLLPEGTILTPHPLEFARLSSRSSSGYEMVNKAREFARTYQVYIVLKGANTAIACPDGTCWFNSTGNPGMATGGSGDVLTGILTGLLAQGYTPLEAALLGVYIHGLSADICVTNSSEEALLAGDIADHLGKAFASLKSEDTFGKAKKNLQI